jgi:hypothetical protein
MRRGWEVVYDNGVVIKESQQTWKNIPKTGIVRLILHYDGRQWYFEDKIAYDQKKRGSVVPGVSDSFQVESRSIGYYDVIDGQPVKVWYTVNEFTGKMAMEVKNL